MWSRCTWTHTVSYVSTHHHQHMEQGHWLPSSHNHRHHSLLSCHPHPHNVSAGIILQIFPLSLIYYDLQLHDFLLNVEGSKSEVHSYSRDVVCAEVVFSESEQQRWLPDPRVSNNDELKQVIRLGICHCGRMILGTTIVLFRYCILISFSPKIDRSKGFMWERSHDSWIPKSNFFTIDAMENVALSLSLSLSLSLRKHSWWNCDKSTKSNLAGKLIFYETVTNNIAMNLIQIYGCF